MYDQYLPFPSVTDSPMVTLPPEEFYYSSSPAPDSDIVPSAMPDVSPLPEDVYGVDGTTQDVSAYLSRTMDGIEELASLVTSTQGYFNSNVLDLLDRVVLGSDKPYYIAYRYDDDSYNAYMYMCSDYELDGNILRLSDSVFVQVYRYRPGSAYTWEYLYEAQDVQDVELTVGGYSMSYTNILPNYPLLGEKSAFDVINRLFIIIFAFLAVIVFMLFRINRKA